MNDKNVAASAARPDLRAPLREAVRERKRKGNANPFHIDASKIPDGMSYEWKRKTIYGQEDIDHQVAMAENGWEPVDVKRHPEFMPPGWTGAVQRGGMVLCERPIELTLEARQEDKDAARQLVRDKEISMGVAPAGTGPRTAPEISKSYEPIVIPD